MVRPNLVLRVWVHERWKDHPAVQQLRDIGHEVTILADDPAPDLILHPAAHCWYDELFDRTERKDGAIEYPFVKVALIAARKRRKENK